MTELEKEESLIDRTNIEPYKPLVLTDLAQRFVPKMADKIPQFVYRYLGKVLHIDEVNRIAESTHNGTGQNFLDEVCRELDFDIQLDGPGLEEFKSITDRPLMFVSNHPYGGPEGIALFSKLHAMFPRTRMLAQSFLKFIRPLSEICVYNKKDLESLKKAVDEKRPLLFYPAGYCSRKLSFGDVFDYDWKPTFVKIAKKNNMPIVVFHTEGSLSKRTLRWTKFRKLFHIKASIETAFLPDEMFKLKGKTLRMIAGHVIYPELLDDSVDMAEWASRIRQYCYELKSNHQMVFDPSKPATLPLN